jgi:hypothetical protein
MAVRTTLAELITQVRTMVGDPAGTDQVLTDQEIQNGLDTHRWEARYMPLIGLISYESGSAVYKVWRAPFGQWESDVALVDAQYSALTPSVSDNLSGRWTFATTQTAVMVTGWSYDLYGASADLLEAMAAKVADQFDYTVDGATRHRSQKKDAYRQLAAEYRKKQQVKVIPQVRKDLEW